MRTSAKQTLKLKFKSLSLATLEKCLQKKIFPDLESGRPNYDKPHTKAVVEHLKAIWDSTLGLELDKQVLVIAAYAHDWGYSGLFKNNRPLQFGDVNKVKKSHMEMGARKLERWLDEAVFDGLTLLRKERAVHLVRVHDELEELCDSDELVLMEADTLAGLDVGKVTPTFDYESNTLYMKRVREIRLIKFITDYGRRKFEELFKLREEYYRSLAR